MFETEIGQIRLSERSNQATGWCRVPVPGQADSRSENLDPIHNNISNHNSKANTERKLNNTVENIWDTYLDTYPGNGVLQSTHLAKNFVLKISIRKKMNKEIKNC